MAVIYTPHFIQFLDNSGNPLSGGKLYTYAAGTTSPKASYTTAAGNIENANPVILDSYGRAVVFLNGAYKFYLTDSNNVPVGPNGGVTDNITSFTALDSTNEPFFESFSGNGSQTAFTTSQTLGTDERAIYVWVDNGLQEHVTNGTFATDTSWTKGAGWTIGSGVATAAGAISTAISQSAAVTLVAGQAYNVTYTVTRSAGGLIPSIGGVNGTEVTASGTYRATIVAGSTQTIAFTGNAFTGTLDTVTITPAVSKGYQILPPTAYTINGTSLTITSAPAAGTGNILVSAPLLLVGSVAASAAAAQAAEAGALAAQAAAELAETNAETAETNAETAETNASNSASTAATQAGIATTQASTATTQASIATAASAFQYSYSTNTTASDPGSGILKFNNATLSSATALYISETTSLSQGISAAIAAWDDSTSTVKGQIKMQHRATAATFALFNITGTITDNGAWDTVTVAYVSGSGSFSDTDSVSLQFIRTGDQGSTGSVSDGDKGDITVSGSGSIWTIDNNAVTTDKILDSNVTTGKINNAAVTLAKIANASANSKLVGSGASGSGSSYAELTLGTNLSMSGTTLNATSNAVDSQVFTSSGTWTKPSSGTIVYIQAWGGGGGGGTNATSAGGGGGGYAERWLPIASLGATETVTIGSGGAVTTAGGNSTLGSLITACGGGAASNTAGGGGGGGGGALAAGGNASGAAGGAGGSPQGGTAGAPGGDSGFGGGGGGTSGNGGSSAYGGGGSASAGSNSGSSVFGGGGGAPGSSGAAGTSKYGGNGGTSGAAGTAPAGGGGRNAAGARGEIRVYTF